MRKIALLTSLTVAFAALTTPAIAKLSAKINLSSQTMTVYENGAKKHSWPISSGKSGFLTPNLSVSRVSRVYKSYRSKKYDAEMYHTVFIKGGFAVHGTKATWRLGKPASHGCVRLSRSNAKRFHNLVNKHGGRNTSIQIVGRTPSRNRVRVASSSQVITLSSSRSKIRRLGKKKSYHAPKRKYIKNRQVSSNRYQAKKGWKSNSWKKYAASMRRKQALR